MVWILGILWQMLAGLSWAAWGRWRQHPQRMPFVFRLLAAGEALLLLGSFLLWEAAPAPVEAGWLFFSGAAALLAAARPAWAWGCAGAGGLAALYLVGSQAAALASLPGAAPAGLVWLLLYGGAVGSGSLAYVALALRGQPRDLHLGVENVLAMAVLAAIMLLAGHGWLARGEALRWPALLLLAYGGVWQPLRFLRAPGLPPAARVWLALLCVLAALWWLRPGLIFS